MNLGKACVGVLGGLVGLGYWFGYQLCVQHGRLLLRLEALEQQLARLPSMASPSAHGLPLGTPPPAGSRLNREGLPRGAPAPVFRLPLLAGGELSLDDFRGRPVLLVLSDPSCEPCDRLAPELERLHRRLPGLQMLMISRGDPELNRAKVAEHRLTFPVALQRHWEVSCAYGMFAMPSAYLVDELGVIAADVAVGAEAIRALVTRHAA